MNGLDDSVVLPALQVGAAWRHLDCGIYAVRWDDQLLFTARDVRRPLRLLELLLGGVKVRGHVLTSNAAWDVPLQVPWRVRNSALQDKPQRDAYTRLMRGAAIASFDTRVTYQLTLDAGAVPLMPSAHMQMRLYAAFPSHPDLQNSVV